jgi:hypothetical protein
VKKKKPELMDKIESGEMTINKAYNEIKEPSPMAAFG